ncbi:DEAD/DEAH box helicase [Thiococcus pfennigii]|uniref:DEAD/DEAH box helicase n=1 Tax=Thiococcus pfennigii TaxID=1057 RepID=UPI0019031250|nr:DEAD/DEAH box helicase [Thiococcus pfennigii]MBK1700237.1 DEAD/DEAH box helicase [Thiococcus pfennigii]
MTISAPALEALNTHWALDAISPEERARASEIVNERLARRAVGRQIDFAFEEAETDEPLLERVALAYEMAAIEGLDALSRASGGDTALRDQAAAASHNAFDIRRLFPVPDGTQERIFHVLQLSALAYCGDRWSDLRRWYKDNDAALAAPSVADAPWDRRLLYRLFNCWVRLFRKKGWDDLDRIREIIAGLREDQRTYEAALLDNGAEAADRAIALRLIALYHWAKGTEILAEYMLQGQPQSVFTQLDKHFDTGIKAATASGDAQHEVILRWLHAAGRIMVTSSLWWGTRTVNSRVSDFVRALTKREHQPMFELLPPQRAALLEQGLLDQAKTAIVVDMPTSGGKTLLAEFRILQALNQFDADSGWVAYVAPTRALSAQITRRLRRDFDPINIRVEQLTGAVEVDAFEEELLTDLERPFDVLVATPEKLSLVIRNKSVPRRLALVVMDEAHNLETESRGLRIEFLLATIKQDCPQANFLLLMPFVESSEMIARWLAQDIDAGKAISFSTTAWKPNERIIGLYRAVADSSERGGWRLDYETLTVTEKAMKLRGTHRAGGCKPINVPKSKVLSKGEQTGFGLQTAAIASVLSGRGTSIAVANNIRTVWSMARHAAESIPAFDTVPDDVKLVQDYLRTEVSPGFELVKMLDRGVGVHHAGLSDEIRSLLEWLAELGYLRVLCATSTIAQGINFPVASIFLASRFVPQGSRSVEIAPREFWNLAGRAGRIGHDSVGVLGLAEGKDRNALIEFISRNTGALASRLVALLDELERQGNLHSLESVLWQEQWEDFRCYVAHLWAEKKSLDAVLAESEQLLRQTFGYTTLRNDPTQRDKADALLSATQGYARKLADMPGVAELADSTGFSPEGVQAAMKEMRNLEDRMTPVDWAPDSLFGEAGKMADLFGVMLKVPQLRQQLDEIGGDGFDHARLSNITKDWVNGARLEDIARTYFSHDADRTETEAFTDACKAIYRAIVNNGTWGVSALSRVCGIDFNRLSDAERRKINTLPAMIYHGVRTEDAVLMRMNSAPRSAAEALGSLYRETSGGDEHRYSVSKARAFLKQMSGRDWNRVRPAEAPLNGAGYRKIWEVLSGEGG